MWFSPLVQWKSDAGTGEPQMLVYPITPRMNFHSIGSPMGNSNLVTCWIRFGLSLFPPKAQKGDRFWSGVVPDSTSDSCRCFKVGMFKIQPFLETQKPVVHEAPSGDHSVRASCYIQWCSSHRLWTLSVNMIIIFLRSFKDHWSLIKSCYSLMNVWNIYQHLPPRWTSYVGKKSCTMEHMGSDQVIHEGFLK